MDRVLPRSLKARTSLLLLTGIAFVQCLSFGIYALDRFWLADRVLMQESKHRALSIYQAIINLPVDARARAVSNLLLPPRFTVRLQAAPDLSYHHAVLTALPYFLSKTPESGRLDLSPGERVAIKNPPHFQKDHSGETPQFFFVPDHDTTVSSGEGAHDQHLSDFLLLDDSKRPRDVFFERRARSHLFSMSMRLSDETRWLVVGFHVPPPNPFGSWTFFAALATMAIGGAMMIALATQRLMTPITTLSMAAERLGNNVMHPPLPETGATEIKRASHAFNQMAARIRRFIRDRTLILTALSHDLRTPLTRMKLRAEFIEDPELRDRFIADLSEMETMVATTLSLGQDVSRLDPAVATDLTVLVENVIEDVAASRPDASGKLSFTGVKQAVMVKAHVVLLRRALTNVILNALIYGGNAEIELHRTHKKNGAPIAIITISDSGPGLPRDMQNDMFEPFTRGESSRNRETGGFGLGLAIARSAIQTHEGSISLENRREGGLRVTMALPCECNETERCFDIGRSGKHGN